MKNFITQGQEGLFGKYEKAPGMDYAGAILKN
jgi:hypothetical protein